MYGYWWNGSWCLTPETPEESRALALVFGALRLERPPLRGRENLPLRAGRLEQRGHVGGVKVDVPKELVLPDLDDQKAVRD